MAITSLSSYGSSFTQNSGTWVNPANAFDTSLTTVTTSSPAASTTVEGSVFVSFPSLPINAIVISVDITTQTSVTTAGRWTLSLTPYLGTTIADTATSITPTTTLTSSSYSYTTIPRSELVDPTFNLRFTAARGTGGTGETVSFGGFLVQVNYILNGKESWGTMLL